MLAPRLLACLTAAAAIVLISAPARAEYQPPPETILHKMSVKFWRGLTNVVTAPAELPKQVYKETRDMGVTGVPVGLLQGVGMIAYRAVFGALETGFFLVPAPGDYEPMIDPPFVWQDWAATAADER